MAKKTRRYKKYIKNKTIKRGGTTIDKPVQESEGVLDMVGDKLSDVASSTATTLGDTGLKIMGLERINKTNEEEENIKKVDEKIGKLSDAASGVASDVGNVLDKTGATVLNSANNILGSDEVKESTQVAAEKTADIVKELSKKFNDTLNKPEVKAQVKEALDNAGEVGEMVVEAAEKPFNKVVDVAAEQTPKIMGSLSAGIMKVATDMLGAVPFVGGIIDLGKAVNDGSKAISASVEAGSEVVEASADAITETTKNIEEGIKELSDKKQESQEISNRTTNSINEFENPTTKVVPNQIVGGSRKTRRRLTKRKLKSKRVRFAV
jgi:methyl-accepting chemotaxis protein